jgi:ABC transporter substrate binding protein
MTSRRTFLVAFAGGLLAAPLAAEAQPVGKVDRIGSLEFSVPDPARQALWMGALVSYGADARAPFRRAALYVSRILNGASPADLPVERPGAFELAVNISTAKILGLTIPSSLLQWADQVIE